MSSRLLILITLSSLSCSLFLLLTSRSFPSSYCASPSFSSDSLSSHHLLFGIASSSHSLPNRLSYLSLWWDPSLRLFLFLDSLPPNSSLDKGGNKFSLPIVISENTSRFPYTFEGGLRSAIRTTRIVKELIQRPDIPKNDVRWIILGDDDTIFILPNLLQTLENYNWREWHYIGARSESFEQNSKHSFNMAFGGGGIAISYPLAAVLATVLDSCIERYGYLFGSDDRIFACLTELGVQLTFEPGFHQIDMHGDISGLLGTLPLSPLISLHHFDKVNPIFPFLNRSDSIHHLFKSITQDPLRALQQSVCYNNNLTISISWGYSVSIFQGNVLLLNVLSTEKTFSAWKNTTESYMFDTRGNKSERAVFFFNNVSGGGIGNGGRIETSYKRYLRSDLPNGLRNLRLVRVKSWKLERINGKILRRHCCDVLTSSNEFLIRLRECKDGELIAMITRKSEQP